MGFETVIGIVVAVIAAIAGAFGLGHIRSSGKAEAKARQQRTEENPAATVAKEASNVQQTVNHRPDDDIDRELRENFTRPGGGRSGLPVDPDYLSHRPRHRCDGSSDEEGHSDA